MRYINTITH